MRDIVPDEQRGNGPKAARRCAVALGSPLEGVGRLVRDHQPALLPSELPSAITVPLPGSERL